MPKDCKDKNFSVLSTFTWKLIFQIFLLYNRRIIIYLCHEGVKKIFWGVLIFCITDFYVRIWLLPCSIIRKNKIKFILFILQNHRTDGDRIIINYIIVSFVIHHNIYKFVYRWSALIILFIFIWGVELGPNELPIWYIVLVMSSFSIIIRLHGSLRWYNSESHQWLNSEDFKFFKRFGCLKKLMIFQKKDFSGGFWTFPTLIWTIIEKR